MLHSDTVDETAAQCTTSGKCTTYSRRGTGGEGPAPNILLRGPYVIGLPIV